MASSTLPSIEKKRREHRLRGSERRLRCERALEFGDGVVGQAARRQDAPEHEPRLRRVRIEAQRFGRLLHRRGQLALRREHVSERRPERRLPRRAANRLPVLLCSQVEVTSLLVSQPQIEPRRQQSRLPSQRFQVLGDGRVELSAPGVCEPHGVVAFREPRRQFQRALKMRHRVFSSAVPQVYPGEAEVRIVVVGVHLERLPPQRHIVGPVRHLRTGPDSEGGDDRARSQGDCHSRHASRARALGAFPHDRHEEADERHVRVPVGPRLHADLHESDDRHECSEIPEPPERHMPPGAGGFERPRSSRRRQTPLRRRSRLPGPFRHADRKRSTPKATPYATRTSRMTAPRLRAAWTPGSLPASPPLPLALGGNRYHA